MGVLIVVGRVLDKHRCALLLIIEPLNDARQDLTIRGEKVYVSTDAEKSTAR